MNKPKPTLFLAALLSAALLAGCGGGGGSAPAPAPDIGQSVSALFDFINNLVTDETSDPIDINSLTLALDDTAEPITF